MMPEKNEANAKRRISVYDSCRNEELGKTFANCGLSKSILDIIESQNKTNEILKNVRTSQAEKLANMLTFPGDHLKDTLRSINKTKLFTNQVEGTSKLHSMDSINSIMKSVDKAFEPLKNAQNIVPKYNFIMNDVQRVTPTEESVSVIGEYTRIMAEDKHREREAHQSMIEIREVQASLVTILGDISRTQEFQAGLLKTLVDDQKASGQDIKKVNSRMFWMTLILGVVTILVAIINK